MNINTKIILNSLLPLVLALTILDVVFSIRLFEIRTDFVKNLTSTKTKEIQTGLVSYFQTYLDTARSLALAFSAFENIPVAVRRQVFSDMLLRVFESDTEILGIWTAWEPDALDGLDDSFANTRGHDATGRFLPYWSRYQGQTEFSVHVDYDKPGVGDWYLLPVQSGEEMVIGPIDYAVANIKKKVVALVVPIYNKTKVLGVVGIDLDILHLNDRLSSINTFRTGHLQLMTPEKILLASSDSTRVYYPKDEFFSQLNKGELVYDSDFVHEGKNIAIAHFAPLFLGQIQKPLILSYVIEKSEIYEDLNRGLFLTILGGIVLMLVFGLVNLFFARKLSLPIKQLNYLVQELSAGEGDLTKKLVVKTKDEIGDLALHFNVFLEKLKTIIVDLININTKSHKIGESLASTSAETSSTVEEIAATLKSINERVAELNAEIDRVAEKTNKITASLNDVERIVDRQKSTLENSSSAIEEIVASIKNFDAITEQKYTTSLKLKATAQEGQNSMEQTIGIITEVAQKAESILELVNVINNIASQTNLLAMNAAIEAAHAGESGKGFAVVADEIRKLAESTSSNSKDISRNLKSIVSSIKQSNLITQEMGQKIGEMIVGIDDFAMSMKEMVSGMKELARGSQQIINSLLELKNVTHEVSESMDSISKNIEGINAAMNSVSNFVSETKNAVNEVTLGMNDISTASLELAKMGVENQENLNALGLNIKKFTI